MHRPDQCFADDIVTLIVDFEKAFDRVRWSSMWRILKRIGIPDKIIEPIKCLREFPRAVCLGPTKGLKKTYTSQMTYADWLSHETSSDLRPTTSPVLQQGKVCA